LCQKIATSVRRHGAPTAGRLQEIDQFLEGNRTDLLLVADAELFRPAADAATCSRRLQSRQRAFADDIALELGLLQFSAKRLYAEPAVMRSREWDQGQNGPPAPRIKPTYSRVSTKIDLSRF